MMPGLLLWGLAWLLLTPAASIKSLGRRQSDSEADVEDGRAEGGAFTTAQQDFGDNDGGVMVDDYWDQPNDTELPKAKVAMCIAGNSRTLPLHNVLAGLKNFTGHMRERAKRFDVFGYTTAQGDGPKGQPHMDFQAFGKGVSMIDGVFRSIGAAAFNTTRYSRTITQKNVDEYVIGREECFNSGYWGWEPDRSIRALNYLHHIQGCLKVMQDYEKEQNVSYQYVIIARPDLQYPRTGAIPPVISMAKQGDRIVYQQDWFFAMPYRATKKFLDPKRAMPLTCHEGEKCCKKVQRTEDMMEYVLEARLMEPCTCGSCYCKERWAAQFGSQKVKFLSIVRPPEETAPK